MHFLLFELSHSVHMQYIIELVRKNCSQGGRESDVHPEIAAFTSVDSVTAKLTPLCSTAHYSLYLFIPWWYVFYSQNFLDDERVAWLEEQWSCCMIMQDMRTLASVCFWNWILNRKKNYTRYPNWLLRYFIIYSGKYLESCNEITKLWKMITIFCDSEFLQRDCRQAWVPNKIPY